MADRHLKLFWWRQHEDSRNLGDEIGPLILERRFGATITKSTRFHADAIGTGSILNWVYENREKRVAATPLHVLGSGLMYPQVDLSPISYLRLHGVRGYLTRSCVNTLDSEDIGVGDPGLLVSDIFPEIATSTSYQVGIIPHVGLKEHESTRRRIEEAGSNGLRFTILDIATDDFEKFFSQMKSCDFILSQTLHGLIFADSFGIPNVWWDDRLLNSKGGRFKFYDYFSTVGRPFDLKLRAGLPLDLLALKTSSFTPEIADVELVKRGIRGYHEKALKGM